MRRLSLTLRLTFFFTLVAAGVVLGMGVVFMAAADQHFIDLDKEALGAVQQRITTIAAGATSVTQVRDRIRDALPRQQGVYAHIVNHKGETVVQTEGFPVVASSHTHSHRQHSLAGIIERRVTPPFRIRHFSVTAPYAEHARLNVTLAMDTTHHQHFLDDLLQTILFYAGIAILVSGGLGWLAVYYGLAPLRAIKAHAAAVTAQRLQANIPVHTLPVEMADLAHALNQMLERLQEDFRRLSAFSSDIAHELRTPISNLLTQTQVTLASPRDNAAYHDILASNAEELQRLARIVSDMLLLAKTERGVDLPHKERFMAEDEVQAVLDFYEAVAEDKSISVMRQGSGAIHGDRLMFHRALSNLLSNALRHTPVGGQIQVVVTERPETTEISVENTGYDIDPQALPRLFDRFYRADPARAHPSADGAGLGLAITKAIIEAYSGRVSVTSAQGLTRFTLQFPR